MTEHPSRCPICLAFYDFGTTWLGQLVAVHPVTRCVAKPPTVYEAEDEPDGDGLEKPERACDECHQSFIPKTTSGGIQVICSARCRKARRDRAKAESNARRGKFWTAANAIRTLRRKHRKVA